MRNNDCTFELDFDDNSALNSVRVSFSAPRRWAGKGTNFVVAKNTISALKDVTLRIQATDFVIIYDPSGCGKSTSFNIILGLDKPTKDEVELRGKNPKR